MLNLSPAALTLALALIAQAAAASSALTVTISGPTVTVTVAPQAVTVLSTSLSTTAAPTATLLATETATLTEPDTTSTLVESATVTITHTQVDYTTAQTVTWVEAPTTTVTENVVATSIVAPRDAFSFYGGCYDKSLYTSSSVALYPIPFPSPYTASTAVAECYYQYQRAKTAFSSTNPVFTYCAVGSDGSVSLSSATTAALASGKHDNTNNADCNQVCSEISAGGVTNAVAADGYGVEYCGSEDGTLVSLYALDF